MSVTKIKEIRTKFRLGNFRGRHHLGVWFYF